MAILVVTLTLAGFGRALASAPQGGAVHDVIPGLHVPLCHTGEAPADPAPPSSHACCDACASSAALVGPAPPAPAGAAPLSPFARLRPAVARAPALARPRDPRLSRGPPAA